MNPIKSFGELDLPQPLLRTLNRIKFETPTPVQAAAIPPALGGKDVLGTAQTGTGKTAAFGIPLVTRIYHQPGKVGLILAPTRELAAQINQVLRQLSKKLKMRGALIVGGESFGRQVGELDRGVDYIVATPGRLNDHLQQGTVRLSRVCFLVIDEMDRMLDMGFAPQIKQIMRRVPHSRQTLLFSATLPKEAANLAMNLLKSPIRIEIEAEKSKLSIEEKTIQTTALDKTRLIVEVMRSVQGKTLIFTRTKARTEKVARALGKSGHRVVNLHGGRTQGQRKRALNMFRAGSHPVLVATDVAGRGIDIIDIEQVVNFDVPQSREDYIHRIGRTGRNGKAGQAINFVTPEDSDSQFVLTGKKNKAKPGASSFRPKKRGKRFRRGSKRKKFSR